MPLDILVVEAQLGVRKALERQLEHLGLRSRSAVSAAQALREVDSLRPDLVLISSNLPDQSGLELCRALCPDLRVVLLGEVNRNAGQQAGAWAVLALPIEPLQLWQMVSTLLEDDALPAPLARPTGETATPNTLAQQLLARPGVLAVSVYDSAGMCLARVGMPLPRHLGQRTRTYFNSARWLANPPASEPICSIQVDYGGRCLLLIEQPGQIIACLLRDSASASVVKYGLRAPDA
ncbi:response regulator [Deinococcus sp.]|uniref:response regulator n=1 Tax=Deinococcus sp. TaxID=47478 RepID=UPI003B59FEAB